MGVAIFFFIQFPEKRLHILMYGSNLKIYIFASWSCSKELKMLRKRQSTDYLESIFVCLLKWVYLSAHKQDETESVLLKKKRK